MTATLHNIGTPRALGHVIGLARAAYNNPHPRDSAANRAYATGYFEGDEQRHHERLIIAPDVDENNSTPAA